jgi:hypothetical protein
MRFSLIYRPVHSSSRSQKLLLLPAAAAASSAAPLCTKNHLKMKP